MIANFASVNNGNGTRSVFCVYSGYEYVYTGVFSWTIMSREHTWAHSWMPTYSSTQNDQYSDQHHIFPTHQNNANGRRSNHPFGKVVNITYQFLEGKLGTDSAGNLVYEPRDSFKGDLARGLFYTVVRYDDVAGNSWSFNWLNNTRLPSLGEDPQSLGLLLSWHRQDPPDKYEVDRNNYIQSVQQNRNPFVDRPEYSAFIDFNNVIKINPSFAAEPSNHVSGFSSSANGNAVQLSWTDAAGPELPDGYMIIAYSRNDYFVPIDGSTYSLDTSLADGYACIHVPHSSPNTYTFSGLQNNTRYYFTAYSYKGSGSQINYKIDGNVPATSALVNPQLSVEPSNHASKFGLTGSTSSTIQLEWIDALPGSQPPSGYLLIAGTSPDTAAPADGVQYADDPVLSDGFARMNIPYNAENTYVFTGLLSGTIYYFRLYSYNGAGSQINYKTTGVIPSASGGTEGVQSANVTVLTDNFSRANSNILGNTQLIGNITWQESETVAPASVSVSSSRMKLGSTTSGREFAFLDLSEFEGYQTVFSGADTTLVWAFNMKQSRADPSGHDNNNYGIAYILGKSTQDVSTGNGYAVVLGQSGSTDAMRLARFTGGLIGNARFTNIVSGGDYSNQYLSIKVTFDPQSGQWSLFADSSSAGFPRTDPRNTVAQIGTAADNFYTSSQLNFSGALWNHVSSANDSAIFDDIYLTDLSLKADISVIPEGLFSIATGRMNISDTVTVELRSSKAPYQLLAVAKAEIDSTIFTGSFRFPYSASGSYYVAVKHRNSIETWSSLPLSLSHGNIGAYDFTVLQSNAFGSNTILKGTRFCIYTGDVNQDGTVDGFDLSIIDNDAFSFLSGYIASDLNGDGFTDASDASLGDNNAFNFVTSIVP